MIQVGNRIYYNQNGKAIFTTGEMQGDVLPRIENEVINYIDLPYGDTTLKDVSEYHIENGQIVIDKMIIPQPTPEELKIQELENQLLVASGVI